MFQLSEMIGEKKVNLALKNLLNKHSYPGFKPVSTDFINELYAITDPAIHSKIDDLFKKITLYNLKIDNKSVRKAGAKYELTLNASANKYYEDGKGHQTKATFNDTVQIAVLFKNGKEMIWNLPVTENQIAGKIQFDNEPLSLLIDPKVKFINISLPPL